MSDLTPKQQQILEFIISFQDKNGFCPSVREIGQAVNLNSTSSVHNNLEKLEQKGYVRKDSSKSRSLEILRRPDDADDPAVLGKAPTATWSMHEGSGRSSYKKLPQITAVPVLGKIHPGQPLLCLDNINDYYPVPLSVVDHHNCFMMRAHDDGMINAGIRDGDLLLIQMTSAASDRDMVVINLGTGMLIRTYFRQKGLIRLEAANDYIEPLVLKECQVIGKVIGLYRLYT